MLVAVSVSCQKNEITQTGKGHLCMTLSVDAATRSVLTEGDVSETAVVNIYKADFSGLVRSYEYSSLPEAVYLAAASYRVDVIAGDMVSDDPAVASWDRKSYKGSAMFDIVSGRTTEVEVIANLNNAVTRIFFDETIEENFVPGYTFTIGLDPTDEQTNLTYEASDSGADGYFLKC